MNGVGHSRRSEPRMIDLYIGVDPGPRSSGLVVYEYQRHRRTGRVIFANKAAELRQLREWLEFGASDMRGSRAPWRIRRLRRDRYGDSDWGPVSRVTVVLERTTAGPPSRAVVATTEVCGRVLEMAHQGRYWHADAPAPPPGPRMICTLYRREILSALDIKGGTGADKRVRARMLELHGGEKRVAVGSKACPGPLYGVSVHAWQALGAVIAQIQSNQVKA